MKSFQLKLLAAKVRAEDVKRTSPSPEESSKGRLSSDIASSRLSEKFTARRTY
jgi:hypothetical protein